MSVILWVLRFLAVGLRKVINWQHQYHVPCMCVSFQSVYWGYSGSTLDVDSLACWRWKELLGRPEEAWLADGFSAVSQLHRSTSNAFLQLIACWDAVDNVRRSNRWRWEFVPDLSAYKDTIFSLETVSETCDKFETELSISVATKTKNVICAITMN